MREGKRGYERVQESTTRYKRVQKGTTGYNRVQESTGGYGRVQKGTSKPCSKSKNTQIWVRLVWGQPRAMD